MPRFLFAAGPADIERWPPVRYHAPTIQFINEAEVAVAVD